MDCKQDIQIKLGANLVAEASYDFGWLRIKVDVNVPVKDLDSRTAKDLKEIPIKSAIQQLQSLLEQKA